MELTVEQALEKLQEAGAEVVKAQVSLEVRFQRMVRPGDAEAVMDLERAMAAKSGLCVGTAVSYSKPRSAPRNMLLPRRG